MQQTEQTIQSKDPIQNTKMTELRRCSCGEKLFEVFENGKIRIIKINKFLGKLIMSQNPIVKCVRCGSWNYSGGLTDEDKYWNCNNRGCNKDFLYWHKKSDRNQSLVGRDGLIAINQVACEEIICDYAIIDSCPKCKNFVTSDGEVLDETEMV